MRYPDEVTIGMGLPILGAIPRLANGRTDDEKAKAPVVEALRAIRFGLQAAYGSAGPLVLAFDRGKGNCLTCHQIKGGDLPGTIGPELKDLKSKYPDRNDLVAINRGARFARPRRTSRGSRA